MLLLSDGGLVKSRRFRDETYVGDPINAVKIFNEKEVDELLLFDIRASREARAPDYELVESIVSEAFMPVAYAGAVRTVETARTLLRVGVEKVAVNTAALDDLGLVRALSECFGAQCIIGAIDVKRGTRGSPVVWSHSGRTPKVLDPLKWMSELVAAGAGEILVQDVDRDGTLRGLDLDLATAVGRAVTVPVILAGGARDATDLKGAFERGVSAVAAGARFVFFGPHRAVLITYLDDTERSLLSGVPQAL